MSKSPPSGGSSLLSGAVIMMAYRGGHDDRRDERPDQDGDGQQQHDHRRLPARHFLTIFQIPSARYQAAPSVPAVTATAIISCQDGTPAPFQLTHSRQLNQMRNSGRNKVAVLPVGQATSVQGLPGGGTLPL